MPMLNREDNFPLYFNNLMINFIIYISAKLICIYALGRVMFEILTIKRYKQIFSNQIISLFKVFISSLLVFKYMQVFLSIPELINSFLTPF